MIPEISALLTPGFPVIQAPMAGVSDSSVVIKATQAGFLGALGAGMMEPETIQKESRNIRAATSAPFCINLFVLEEPSSNAPDLAPLTWLTDLYAWHNIPFSVPEKCAPSFPAQFEAVLAEAPAVLSCTFGQLSKDQIAACHARNIAVVGTATSTPEALAWADAGADAICAQGIEAGGHRGSFLTAQDQAWGFCPSFRKSGLLSRYPLLRQAALPQGAPYWPCWLLAHVPPRWEQPCCPAPTSPYLLPTARPCSTSPLAPIRN